MNIWLHQKVLYSLRPTVISYTSLIDTLDGDRLHCRLNSDHPIIARLIATQHDYDDSNTTYLFSMSVVSICILPTDGQGKHVAEQQ
jgi:hypothetical protein